MTMPETTQSDLVERLRALDSAATPGPWAYRPDEYDDWGVVKAPPRRPEGFEYDLRCVLAKFRDPAALDDATLDAHRRAKTDPWRGNAELVTFLRNAVPEIIAMAEDAARLRAHCEAMACALAPFAKAGSIAGERNPYGDFYAYRPAAGDEFAIFGDHLREANRILAAYCGENAS